MCGELLFIQQFIDGDEDMLEFFYHIKNADDYEKIDLAQTTHGELEIAKVGFVDPKTERVLPDFLQIADITEVIRRGKTVDVINYTS